MFSALRAHAIWGRSYVWAIIVGGLGMIPVATKLVGVTRPRTLAVRHQLITALFASTMQRILHICI